MGKVREGVTVVCPGWAGSGEGKAPQLSHWGVRKWGEFLLWCRALAEEPELLWEMHRGHWVLHRGGQEHTGCYPGDVRGISECVGRCQQREPGQPAAGAALLLNSDFPGIHLVLPWEAPPVPEESQAGLCFLSLVPAWRHCPAVRNFGLVLLFRASERWLLLIWQHCCHGNEDFIVPCLSRLRERKATFYGCYLGWKGSETIPPLLGVPGNFHKSPGLQDVGL